MCVSAVAVFSFNGSRISIIDGQELGKVDMPHRGKLLILSILLLALALAVFSIWYQRSLAWRSQEYFGPQAAELILQAPIVEALKLTPSSGFHANPPERILSVGGQAVVIAQQRDVSTARGLANVRRGLLSDRSYDWDAAPAAGSPTWDYALCFKHGDREATLLFSTEESQALLAGRSQSLSTSPVTAGLSAFFAEHLAESQPAKP